MLPVTQPLQSLVPLLAVCLSDLDQVLRGGVKVRLVFAKVEPDLAGRHVEDALLLFLQLFLVKIAFEDLLSRLWSSCARSHLLRGLLFLARVTAPPWLAPLF